MHELLLLRHAQAEPVAPAGNDIDRELSAFGQSQADAVGRWLAGHVPQPDLILCSPAMRTRATLERALQALASKKPPIRFEDAIYDATPGTLMALLQQHAEADCVLLVGHNPGLEHLVALLCQGRSPDYRGMPSAALAHIHLDGPIEPGNGRLLAFHTH